MVGPERKREAVLHVRRELVVSERRACTTIRQPRSTQRYRGGKRGRERRWPRNCGAFPRSTRVRATAWPRPCCGEPGWRSTPSGCSGSGGRKGCECRAGSASASGLGAAKAARSGCGPSGSTMCGATAVSSTRPRTGGGSNGCRFVMSSAGNLVALEVERRMEARDVIRILDEAVIQRGSAPEFIRSDNGPEFVALAVQEWIARRGFKTLYIQPGSPWQNAYSESFNSRFRDEFLNREAFASVLEAKVLGKQHRQRHNHERPHSSLDYQTPVEFAQRRLAAASATLRQPQGGALSTEHQTHNQTPEPNQKLS